MTLNYICTWHRYTTTQKHIECLLDATSDSELLVIDWHRNTNGVNFTSSNVSLVAPSPLMGSSLDVTPFMSSVLRLL